jgi:hypothetical protein
MTVSSSTLYNLSAAELLPHYVVWDFLEQLAIAALDIGQVELADVRLYIVSETPEDTDTIPLGFHTATR